MAVNRLAPAQSTVSQQPLTTCQIWFCNVCPYTHSHLGVSSTTSASLLPLTSSTCTTRVLMLTLAVRNTFLCLLRYYLTTTNWLTDFFLSKCCAAFCYFNGIMYPSLFLLYIPSVLLWTTYWTKRLVMYWTSILDCSVAHVKVHRARGNANHSGLEV